MMRSIASLACLVFVAGCQSPSLYNWGEYEESVYELCSGQGEADLGQQAAWLQELIDEAGRSERGVPPGAHAHLAYLLYLQGDVEGAFAGFHAEKVAYPEATVFVDGLLARLRRGDDAEGDS